MPFFDTITVLSNMKYFNAQQIAYDHCVDKWEINWTLFEDVHVVMDGDGVDPELDDLQHAWMVKDARKGLAEAINGSSGRAHVAVAVASPSRQHRSKFLGPCNKVGGYRLRTEALTLRHCPTPVRGVGGPHSISL